MSYGACRISSEIVICMRAGFSQRGISNVRIYIFRQDLGNHVGRPRNADFFAGPSNQVTPEPYSTHVTTLRSTSALNRFKYRNE
jgi:hypothetical protein